MRDRVKALHPVSRVKRYSMINVGIIGCGFVGGALKDWLEHNNPECKLFISDPPKGYNDD